MEEKKCLWEACLPKGVNLIVSRLLLKQSRMLSWLIKSEINRFWADEKDSLLVSCFKASSSSLELNIESSSRDNFGKLNCIFGSFESSSYIIKLLSESLTSCRRSWKGFLTVEFCWALSETLIHLFFFCMRNLLSSQFLQPEQLHSSLQIAPARKHSQYFFSQPLFLHLHPPLHLLIPRLS